MRYKPTGTKTVYLESNVFLLIGDIEVFEGDANRLKVYIVVKTEIPF